MHCGQDKLTWVDWIFSRLSMSTLFWSISVSPFLTFGFVDRSIGARLMPCHMIAIRSKSTGWDT